MLSRFFGGRAVSLLLPVVVPVLVTSALLACSGLKRADDAPDAAVDGGGDEAPVTGDDAGVADAGPDAAKGDAGAPPPDFECPTDPWTRAVKGTAACAPRQVKVLEAVAPTEMRGLSIARTPAGRVGIVYDAEIDVDTGEMHFVYFTPTTPVYPAPKLLIRPSLGLGSHEGFNAKIAASAPDTLALLTYDCTEVSGEVHLRKLVAGTEPLTDDPVALGVPRPTELGFGSDLAGNTVATYRVSTGATSAKLASKKGSPAGLFTALPDLGATLHPNDTAGIGGASIFVDPTAQVHLLYHHNDDGIAPLASKPRYHTLGGSVWSAPKTVDNTVPDGYSGYSGSLAVFGTKKYAAVFFRQGGQAPLTATADLRLVSWDAFLDMPTLEVLEQHIPSADPLNPAYRVAIAVDKFGLVHVAVIVPTDLKNGYLEYRRQVRLPAGGTKWLSDIVDPDVISDSDPSASAFVDMVVDENARPHIAYRSAQDGLVRYATRFDR